AIVSAPRPRRADPGQAVVNPHAAQGRSVTMATLSLPGPPRVTDDAPRIWVDADACPGAIKDILFRAAERTRVRVTLVANQWLRTPPSRFIDALQVPGGFDVADSAIVERVRSGDLVVTQDIPLAARVLERGADALNPRG